MRRKSQKRSNKADVSGVLNRIDMICTVFLTDEIPVERLILRTVDCFRAINLSELPLTSPFRIHFKT